MNTSSTINPTTTLSSQPGPLSRAGENVRLPTFLIIGAGLSGTTTLHYVLGQHPQIYMSPNKETNFFAYHCSGGDVPSIVRKEDIGRIDSRSVKSLDDYRFLFRGVTNQIAIGESSPAYLITPGVPEAIRELLPEAKLVAMLRQPIERGYSAFQRRCRRGTYSYDDDFAEILERDDERIRREGRGISILDAARYYGHLKRFYDVFPAEQIKVCLLSDMQSRPREFYSDLFRFLGVDESFRPDHSAQFNTSGRPKSAAFARLTRVSRPLRGWLHRNLPAGAMTRLSRTYHKLQAANIEKHPTLPPQLRRELTRRYYGEEIEKLQGLIGRDLSFWLD